MTGEFGASSEISTDKGAVAALVGPLSLHYISSDFRDDSISVTDANHQILFMADVDKQAAIQALVDAANQVLPIAEVVDTVK